MKPKRPKRHTGGWTGQVRPVDVGLTLRLVPYWERRGSGDRAEVVIDPGASFGAGDHPTTLMALEFIEEAVTHARDGGNRPSVLDVGTGTGVLALAAKVLGAGMTVGLDIDPSAIFSARRNALLNRFHWSNLEEPAVEWFVGGVEAVGGTFDIVAANLAAPTLLRIGEDLSSRVEHSLVVSGIAEAMVDDVMRAFSHQGLTQAHGNARDGWHAALFRRQ
jgi:ribosomal protein L11 methyltransferase